jgi:hypothetical protein
LIEELQPDTVLVQTNQEWWNDAKMLRYVNSQDELNKYSPQLDRHTNAKYQDIYWSNRRWLALFRFYFNSWLFNWHFGIKDFNFTRPGFEVKQACEAAEKVGARLEFLGPELNQTTWERVHHEARLSNLISYVTKVFQYRDT